MAVPTKEKLAEVKAKGDARVREAGVSEEVIAKGEDPDAYIDLYENNDGELAIVLGTWLFTIGTDPVSRTVDIPSDTGAPLS